MDTFRHSRVPFPFNDAGQVSEDDIELRFETFDIDECT